MKHHQGGGTRIRAVTVDYSHEPHEKTRNINFSFMIIHRYHDQKYPLLEIKLIYSINLAAFQTRGVAPMKLDQNIVISRGSGF